MSRSRSGRAGAVALALMAVVAASGCEDRSDPREAFLVGWLERRASRLEPRSIERVVEAVLAAERETGTDAFLVLAVIEEESRYDPSARSHKGARGLMQLRPETARAVAARSGLRWTGAAALDDPEENVRLGATYLAEMKREFGDWRVALSAYHNGPTKIRGVRQRGRKVPTGYASRVLRRHRQIHDAFEGTGD